MSSPAEWVRLAIELIGLAVAVAVVVNKVTVTNALLGQKVEMLAQSFEHFADRFESVLTRLGLLENRITALEARKEK